MQQRSFVRDLGDLIFPRNRFFYALHFVALYVGLAYWADSFRFEPDLPLDVRVLYRIEGDTQYIGLIGGVARGTLGESLFAESYGTGILSFPFGSISVHAVCVALFGSAGFTVADALWALLYYFALAAFLTVLGVPSVAARVAALLCAAGVTEWVWAKLLEWGELSPALRVELWGLRLPRPLASEPIWLFTLTLAAALATRLELRWLSWYWVLLGASFALTVQSDIYAATVLAPVLLLAVVVAATTKPRALGKMALSCATLTATLAVALAPFVWQVHASHPDVPRRLGVYAVERWPPLELLEAWRGRFAHTSLALASLVAFAWGQSWRSNAPARVVSVLAALTLSAWTAMPQFIAATGRGIQLYHFEVRWWNATSYVLVACACLGGAWMSRAIPSRARIALPPSRPGTWRLVAPTASALAVASFCAFWLLDAEYIVRRTHPRFGDRYSAEYKTDFIELTHALRRTAGADRTILGTFDHAVFLWWTALHGRFAFIGDPFQSTRPDRELELRFMALCSQVGLSTKQFEKLVRDPEIQIFWLSHNKYNVSGAHSFSHLGDYPEATQKVIRSKDILAGWNIVPPASEVRRLTKDYRREVWSGSGFALPHLIVLTTVQRDWGANPAASGYVPVFSNSTFEVWRYPAGRKPTT